MAELTDAKRQLLEARMATRVVARATPSTIPTRPPGPVPLSAGQAALLYEHQLHPGGARYNVVHRYRLSGSHDGARLARAIRSAAALHEPFRHGFGPDRRRLTDTEAIEVVEVTADDAGVAILAQRQATQRFDVVHGPLLRATLINAPPAGDPSDGRGTGPVELVLAAHHISCDAASWSQLWRDIDGAYRGETLSRPAVSYSDHALWQAARRTEADTAFWLEHLGGDAAAPELALAAPLTAQPDGYRSAPLTVTPAALTELGLRPVPFFLGLFAALLQRYTDTDHVVVGLTASVRDHPAVEHAVGYFLNLLPLRLAVDPDVGISELIRRTDTTLAAALARRHVPYAEIASALRRAGAGDTHPGRIMFVLDEPPRLSLDGSDVSSALVHNEHAVTELTLFVRRRDQHYEIAVEWDGSRLAAADVEHLMAEYQTLATWALRHPSTPIRAAPAQPDLVGPALITPLRPLPELIAGQCRSTPAASAVRCGDDQLNYGELAARVAVLAAGLAARGVRAGDRVGVQLGRSTDLVAAVLAVQWIGAAYVPIDPDYPPSRAQLILEAARPTLTIVAGGGRAASSNGDGNPAGAGRGRVLDGSGLVTVEELCREQPSRPDPVATLADPAYVIFTSGSTGIPRGVPIGQRQLAASTQARLQHYGEPVGRYLLVSSFGFDSSVAGLFWTLATGGEVVLPTEAEAHDVDALVALAQRQQVTHLLMVPTLYRALLGRAATGLASLRCAIVAGEPCPASLVAQHHHVVPAATLWNEYGPTEATVWATVQRCLPGTDPVPIGTVIPGARARVADRWMRPRPVGAAGELAIGGPGLAAGYLDRPEETTRVFVDDPAGRFYRSGDLVRRAQDGTLLFLGRIDHQLNVGGARFEPEEIEAVLMDVGGRAALVRMERQIDGDVLNALSALPGEVASAMLRRAADSSDPGRALAEELATQAAGREVLVAYVEGEGLDPDRLRAAMRRRLPAAVVPSVITVVPGLARTEHGKIDRKALPPPLRAATTLTGTQHVAGAAPQNHDGGAADLEAPILDVWRAVLGQPNLDVDSDFFEAGGDSLLAVEVAAKLEQRLGRRVPISALVLGRTPRRLQSLMETASPERTPTVATRRSHVVPLRSAGERPPLLVMPPGGGNLIVFDSLVQALDPTLPVMGFELPGFVRDEDLPTSVESLCDTYLPQLRAVQPCGPYRFLGWSFGGVIALEMAQRLRAQGEDVDLVAMIDTLVPGLQRSGRGRAYVELIRQRDLLGLARKVSHTITVRLRLRLVRHKGRRAQQRGAALDAVDRNTWLTIKVDEIVERYRPRPYLGRVVFFAANRTHPWRTTDPWRMLIHNFEVVPIDGAHDGANGLLSGDRARFIAQEVAARLP
ncbi:MAG: non-ribosomal peptide synthetase [Acidimicrobiales bacterium]